ncbi:hypothetical protein JCM10213_009176 [Rhodosporidiobolus nylandii]
MKIVQQLSYHEIQDVAGTKLVGVAFGAHPPPPFNQGCWLAGWSEIDTNGARLTFVWAGASLQVVPHKLEIRFLRSSGGPGQADEVVWSASFSGDPFPHAATGILKSPRGNHAVALKLEVELPVASPVSSFSYLTNTQTDTSAAITAGPAVLDVRLSFPRQKRELWTSSAVLSQSPYFATLLSSGFFEDAGEEAASSTPAADAAPFDDSDDETDGHLPKPPAVPASSLPPHKTISITEASYSTYLAVVCWMQCGHISFAPLASSFRTSTTSLSEAAQNRKAAIFPPSSDSSSPFPPPTPVSPKSAYRLAHLLELPTLAALSLANFRSQLTPQNVACELFSDVSACYDEVCDAALDFTLKNLKEVFESEGMKRMEEKAASGELSTQEGMVWAKLAVKLVKER